MVGYCSISANRTRACFRIAMSTLLTDTDGRASDATRITHLDSNKCGDTVAVVSGSLCMKQKGDFGTIQSSR